jgi:fatty-acyl-CoA synthase
MYWEKASATARAEQQWTALRDVILRQTSEVFLVPLRFIKPEANVYRFPLTIRHLLDSALASASDQRIIYRELRSYSYSEFAERIGRLASMLADLGVREGMTVAVMDWDSHRYLESFFAVPMMGAVLQTVNVRLPPPQIAYTLQHAQAEILLVHQDFFPLIEPLLPSVPSIKSVIAMHDGSDCALPSWVAGEYEALSESASPSFGFEDFDENAVATTFYTSGTTGNPKGVCFTHRQLVLHTLATCGPFGASEKTPALGFGDAYMPLTPMFHVHAWGMPYVATMLGLNQVYPGRYDPDLLCRLRHRYQVTFSHCVPTVLQMILRAADYNGVDLTGWKMLVGGSALSKELFLEAQGRGMQIAVGYGMSETAPIVSLARPRFELGQNPAELAAVLTSAGVTIPLVSARIVDETMRQLAHDDITRGELVLRAPWLTQCYTGNAQASAELWQGGWLHTQDIATINQHGHIRIRDRLKDIIKSGGEWIDSIQLEQLVASAHGVSEASVVAIPDVKWGERPLAVVVPKTQTRPSLFDLNAPIEKAIAEGEITPYARLQRVEFVDSLPRTSVGKIDKKLLRARFCGNSES